MEVYTLSRDYESKLEQIIENIESFIWTERYSAYGDFELVVKTTAVNLSIFVPEVRLYQSNSVRVMVVKTVENALTSEGKRVLIVKGYSLESLMMDKIARPPLTSTFPHQWITNRPPADLARVIYKEIMYEGARNINDKLENVGINEIPRVGTIPEPSDKVRMVAEPTTVYNKIKEICDAYGLGFMMTRSNNTGRITFRVYMGYDRTSSQTANKAVLFSTALDNLHNTRDIKSSVGYKNVAEVYSSQGRREVFAPDVTADIKGEDRRVMVIKATELATPPVGTETRDHLIRTGLEALAEHRRIHAFDGEVSQYSPYEYGVDYNLGDLVEYQNEDGGGATLLVTEQIFALDAQGGYRSYPTLTLHVNNQPGTWSSWDQNIFWNQLTTQEWNTMP